MEGIFEILERNGFHQPENPFPLARRICFKTAFSLDEKKTCINVWYLYKSLAEISEKQIKKVFPLARKSLSTNRNAFQNTFPLDGKVILAVAGVYQNGRKKLFSLTKKSVATRRNKVIFQKLDLPVSTNRTNEFSIPASGN